MQEEGIGTGLFGLGLSGLGALLRLGRAGVSAVKATPRMAGQAFRQLPVPVQRTIVNTAEYGPPAFDLSREIAKGRDPLQVTAEIVSGEVGGRKLRAVTGNPLGKFVLDPLGNLIGQEVSRQGAEFGIRMGQQPAVAAPASVPSTVPGDPTMPEWRRRLEQGY